LFFECQRPSKQDLKADKSVNFLLTDLLIGLSHAKQFLDHLYVGLVQQSEVIQISFTLLSLLGQNVTVVSVFSLDFARSGKSESFFGTGISL
jgi:hypothetical protein